MQTALSAIREVPASSQLAPSPEDPARQSVYDEPVLRIENIQGSILPGFSKSHRILLFLKINRKHGTAVAAFKR